MRTWLTPEDGAELDRRLDELLRDAQHEDYYHGRIRPLDEYCLCSVCGRRAPPGDIVAVHMRRDEMLCSDCDSTDNREALE